MLSSIELVKLKPSIVKIGFIIGNNTRFSAYLAENFLSLKLFMEWCIPLKLSEIFYSNFYMLHVVCQPLFKFPSSVSGWYNLDIKQVANG